VPQEAYSQLNHSKLWFFFRCTISILFSLAVYRGWWLIEILYSSINQSINNDIKTHGNTIIFFFSFLIIKSSSFKLYTKAGSLYNSFFFYYYYYYYHLHLIPLFFFYYLHQFYVLKNTYFKNPHPFLFNTRNSPFTLKTFMSLCTNNKKNFFIIKKKNLYNQILRGNFTLKGTFQQCNRKEAPSRVDWCHVLSFRPLWLG
jgi:hypothetical protein